MIVININNGDKKTIKYYILSYIEKINRNSTITFHFRLASQSQLNPHQVQTFYGMNIDVTSAGCKYVVEFYLVPNFP